MACLVLLTPLASVSAFLCTSGASIYASRGQVVEAVSEHLHRIGRVLLQISLRSGRFGLLVRGSLPSLSPLAVTHCQIPLPGFQLPTSYSSSKFFLYFIIIMSGLAQVEERSPGNSTSRKLSKENKEISGTNYCTQSKYG